MSIIVSKAITNKNINIINKSGEFTEARVSTGTQMPVNLSFTSSLLPTAGGFVSADKKRITYLTSGNTGKVELKFDFPVPEKELEIEYFSDSSAEKSESVRLVRSINITSDGSGLFDITIDSAETVVDMNEKNAELDKKISHITAQKNITKAQLDAKQQQYDALVAAQKEYAARCAQLDSDITDARKDIEISNSLIRSKQEEYDAVAKERESLASVKEAMEIDTVAARAEIDGVKARLRDDNISVEMMDDLFKLKKPLKKKLDEVQKTIEEAEKQIGKYIAVQEMISAEIHKTIAESDGDGYLSAGTEAGGK